MPTSEELRVLLESQKKVEVMLLKDEEVPAKLWKAAQLEPGTDLAAVKSALQQNVDGLHDKMDALRQLLAVLQAKETPAEDLVERAGVKTGKKLRLKDVETEIKLTKKLVNLDEKVTGESKEERHDRKMAAGAKEMGISVEEYEDYVFKESRNIKMDKQGKLREMRQDKEAQRNEGLGDMEVPGGDNY